LKKIGEIIDNRYIVLYFITFLVAIIFIIQLINIQIINGKSYREKSEKRMLRTESVVAPRGEIYDRNGVVLATSKLAFNVEMYRVRVETEEQNAGLEKLINIIESNGDKIYSTFPANENLTGFNFSDDEAEKKWKKEMKIDENATFDDTIAYYIKRYELENITNKNMQIKVIELKYEGALNAYSLFNSTTIAKDISEKSVATIEERKQELYGINVVSVPKRYYTNSFLTSHVLGYVSKVSNDEYVKLKESGYSINSEIGKAGIEQSFEKYLKGEDGVKKSETDILGNISSETTAKEPVSGKNVTLTIDYRLQKVAQESLETVIKGLVDGTLVKKKIADANAGSVVVLDVETGEVLAMANYPNYDTNIFVDGISQKEWTTLINDPVKPMYNRAISGTYSPGSTYKMLVGIAGLKSGGTTVQEKIRDPGIYPYAHNPKCWIFSQYGKTHGYVNFSEAIKVSCNCYFYEIGRRIGISKIVEYSKLFGLGSKTGIELSNEVSGQIAGDTDLKNWYLGDTLSAAIGQSYNSYTPIQLANYISTIANGGDLNKLSVIKQVKGEADFAQVAFSEIEEYSKKITGVDFQKTHIDLDPTYIEAVKQGMYSVTNDYSGTASIVFKNSNIKVAGKTGTSQVTSGSNNGIFVGFAPYDKPKIAVVAIIEHGGEGTYTANVVKPIMEEYFNISSQDKANEKEQNIVDSGIKF
jgi:penicillin-binding protein 2